MIKFSIYDLSNGLFQSCVEVNDIGQLTSCLLPTQSCVLGEYDHLSQKVNLETGEVEDYVPPQPSENHVWNADTKRWDYVPPRIELEQKAWKRIKLMRDSRQSGGVKVGDYWLHSDVDSRLKYLGLVAMGQNMPTGIQWKTMSGEFVTMNPELAQQIFSAISTYDMQVFAVAEKHKVEMLASDNPVLYNFSAGWPAIYGEQNGSNL